MEETQNKQQATTHKIGIYLWIWGLLFVLSFFSYMVDWFAFQGLLRWTLILTFMFLKAGLIMAFFMHLFWERYALVNVLLWPMTAIACFIGLMVAEGKYTVFTRLLYFFTGGG
jgi:cytochrome c oxidase subunit IV